MLQEKILHQEPVICHFNPFLGTCCITSFIYIPRYFEFKTVSHRFVLQSVVISYVKLFFRLPWVSEIAGFNCIKRSVNFFYWLTEFSLGSTRYGDNVFYGLRSTLQTAWAFKRRIPLFLQICVSSFRFEHQKNGVQYPCMGMPDLITLEQFVINNGTPRISGKALEAFIHQQQKRRSFSIWCSTRIIVVRFVKPF